MDFLTIGVLAWIPAIRIHYLAKRMGMRRLRWTLTVSRVVVIFVVIPGIIVHALLFGPREALQTLGSTGWMGLMATTMVWWNLRMLQRRGLGE